MKNKIFELYKPKKTKPYITNKIKPGKGVGKYSNKMKLIKATIIAV